MRILSWNTWFDPWMQDERQEALWAEVDALSPDVVCLQEVLAEQVERVWRPEALRRGYWANLDIPVRYGVATFTRRQVIDSERKALPSVMGRELLVARLDEDPPLTVATVHLESTAEMAPARARQLSHINDLLSAERDVVLVGDMNFPPEASLESQEITAWQDAWAVLRPDEPGYTIDTGVNAMRFSVRQQEKQARIDRVFFRGEEWKLANIERVGMGHLPDDPKTFASDHFGLVVDLSVSDSGEE